MIWETVIGLETHVELATRTKIFCGCSTSFGAPPNTHCCPVCTGMPGALPVLNRRAVLLAVRAGLALGCTVSRRCAFDRKNYFYPDLPKAYQISQLYLPLCRDGAVDIGGGKTIRIAELHLEEDAGKLVHDPWTEQSLADFNRCGVPLIEIVTRPDFSAAEEVIAYLEKLKLTLQYLGVSDCKIQEGSLRCDVNLSVRPAGSRELGTRTELKNLGSFKAIARAIDYEARRQIELLEEGRPVVQQTRRWDENKDATFPMRSKENAQDYRYFPDPDLPPLELEEAWLDSLAAAQPEMAWEKAARYQTQWGLSADDARTLTGRKPLADYFEAVVELGAPPRRAAGWVLGQLLAALGARGLEAEHIPLPPAALARLIHLVETGALNRNTAARVLEAVFDAGGDVDGYVAAHGLGQISDPAAVEEAARAALAANPKALADWRAGKGKAKGFLVGQVMARLQGRADPALVNRAVDALLEESK